ncbi:MAG: dinitrogenase iron-molybdenum cofactor biosynthesis protein [Lachnospiraceae bacterium]|nr:dinitrogenase iron-molybdenum cofactor biosynthesis protein [Lachnospiraceae bacterium]
MASTDGKVVNQHFGRADRFYIVEFCEKTHTLHLLEERRLAPVCRGGDHEEKSLREQAEQLADCRYVLVSRIGRRAETELERRGIQVFEIPGVIEEAGWGRWTGGGGRLRGR